jgi:membrane associated rhomboid family serine protease
VVLGALVLRRNEAQFVEVAVTIAIAQGTLLWLFGRNASHVGMSGVIFGFLGYLLAVAWFTRTTGDLAVAGGVMLVYGGLLAGLKPARGGTSWEGHLFGLLAGLARAWLDTR